ncbi:MAG: methylated-DNA--[protein]-cysteine S-methyltransferase [Gammaproteobacteria bacterium]|nr:MAG: methylated-DNA--[protein]-cysteine S-methyltransferase [Gammaproteobacteria bacterium]
MRSHYIYHISIILTRLSMKDYPSNLKTAQLETKLGPMMAVADENGLYLLEFITCQSLRKKLKAVIIPGETSIIKSIKAEIAQYFEGKINQFNTPIHLTGSPFQKRVWEELRTIPFGETRSYLEIAKSLKKPTAFRAVAQANGANQLAIVVPCHRVINANGKLGGYNGGVDRKQWLLEHERYFFTNV